jgi:hypothetical protein
VKSNCANGLKNDSLDYGSNDRHNYFSNRILVVDFFVAYLQLTKGPIVEVYKDETKEINGVKYSRYPEEYSPNPFWRPEEHEHGHPFVCPCGSTEFQILITGSYETSGRCLKCGNQDVVHSG